MILGNIPISIFSDFPPSSFYVKQLIGRFPYLQEVSLVDLKPLTLIKNFPVECVGGENRKISDGLNGILWVYYQSKRLAQIPVQWVDAFILEDKGMNKKYEIIRNAAGINGWRELRGSQKNHYSFQSIKEIFRIIYNTDCEECLLDRKSRIINTLLKEIHHPDPEDEEIVNKYDRKNLNEIVAKKRLHQNFLWEFFAAIHNNYDFCQDLKAKHIFINDKDIKANGRYIIDSIKADFRALTICTSNKLFYELLGLANHPGGHENIYQRDEVLRNYFGVRN